MLISKRNIPLFMLVTLLAIAPFKLSAQSSVDSDDQAGVAADQPAYDQPQADDNDQYGGNDDQEANGESAPPPRRDEPGRVSQDPTQPTLSENTPDAPARAARLQYMSGSISIQPQGTGDWASGELNRPLTNGDNVWADKNSRAELSVGSGLIRLDSESSLTLSNIDQNTVQLQLHQGAMIVHVRRLYDNEIYEVDTPNQAFTVSKPGDYRFDVDPNADTTVITIWHGEGKSTGNGPEVALRENEQVRFTGNEMSDQIHAAPRMDDFDQWASSRDERMDHSKSARYVSPDVPGYEDLDEYGTWNETPDYGAVWVPRHVSVGWAPYRYGHWIWVSPWGWTWVEDEPWGYAPFHYGRWVYWGSSWAWAPGPVYVRPYYAPALVAWFGGPSFGVSIGFGGRGGYGWCPLGFGEPYVPWYHVSRGYFNRVNITNTRITNVNITNVYNNTYIHNNTYVHNGGGSPGRPPAGGGPYGPHSAANIHYANMRAPNGFTAVSRETLVRGQRVDRNALRVSPNQMSRLTPVHALDVRPTRAAVVGSRAAVTPPSRSFARPTVSRMSPPNARSNAGSGARPTFGNNSQRPNPAARGEGQRPTSQARNGGIDRPASAMGNPGAQRPTPNVSNRGGAPVANPNNNMRMPERGAISPRSVPRPPSAGGSNTRIEPRGGMNRTDNGSRPSMSRSGQGPENGRGSTPQMRPQSASRGSGGNFPGNGGRTQMGSPRDVGNPRVSAPAPRSNERIAPRSDVNMPRSSGSAPRSSYEANSRPGAGYDRTYGRPMPNNGGGAYNRPVPSYDRGSTPRSMPSYGRGPSNHAAPAYSSGRSMPHSQGAARSMPSYGGGRPPSYGGGARPSGGFGGGGGRVSAPPSHGSGGGGGHAGGGGNHGGHR
jgi:hypothetical protein